MTREEATALFERIYETFSCRMYPITLHLNYYQAPGLLGQRPWSITIKHWNTPIEYEIGSEQGWHDYKMSHSILETVEDTEAYADLRRNEALNELE